MTETHDLPPEDACYVWLDDSHGFLVARIPLPRDTRALRSLREEVGKLYQDVLPNNERRTVDHSLCRAYTNVLALIDARLNEGS